MEEKLKEKEVGANGKEAQRVLFLDVEAECYSPSYPFDYTMNVGELRELLEDYDDDTKLIVRFNKGYSFGGVTEETFQERDVIGDDTYLA